MPRTPLIECPGCGNWVSQRATACPQCGHPLGKAVAEPDRQPARSGGGLWGFLTRPVGWVGTLALILVFIGGRYGLREWQKRDTERREREAREQAEEQIKKQVAEKAASRAADEELSRRLVGTWTGTFQLKTLSMSLTATYRANGTYHGEGTLREGDGPERDVRDSGTWRIENKKITEKTTESNDPELLPVGDTSTSDILTLTEAEFVFRTKTGHTFTLRRVAR